MIDNLSKTINSMFAMTFPMVIISVVVVVSIRVVDIIRNKKKIVFYKEILALFFIIYILCLFQIVTFQDASAMQGNNFIPFREIFRYSLGSRLFLKNVLGNVLLFLPYGFFTTYYLKEQKLFPILFLILLASLSIEITQSYIGRVFDIDDIILNTMGGILGFYFYQGMEQIGQLCPKIFYREWFLNFISLLLLIGFLMFL